MLCVVIKGPSYREAAEQLQQAVSSADLAELRLDFFESLDKEKLQGLQKAFRIPMVFTLRSKSQGGNYALEEHQRLIDIESIAYLKPAYLDIEYNVSPSFIQELQKKHPEIKFILSYHDFYQTPEVGDVLKKMQATPASFYKIATMAQSTIDALRSLEFIRNNKAPLFLINMGEEGQLTRILQPVCGKGMTYATLNNSLATAPGQLTIDTLVNQFHYKKLHPSSVICGLIGDPVTKSLSHITHNAVMSHKKLDGVYVKMKISPNELRDFFSYARTLPFRGLSVTMPLKEEVQPYLDEIDPIAKKMGAVNTIFFKDNRLIGYNTDGKGALEAIEKQTLVKDKRMIILGAGGAAKAIAYIALQRGAHVCILNRDPQRAEKAAEELGCSSGGLDQMKLKAKEGYEILVNCTPISMPIDAETILPNTHLMDIKTRPMTSDFLARGLERNCKVTYGYEMFVHQAVAQFEIWFGENVNPTEIQEIIEQAALNVLTKDN